MIAMSYLGYGPKSGILDPGSIGKTNEFVHYPRKKQHGQIRLSTSLRQKYVVMVTSIFAYFAIITGSLF